MLQRLNVKGFDVTVDPKAYIDDLNNLKMGI